LNINYKKFIIYDNFGNYLISINTLEQFRELNAYLRSNKKNGIVVYYFDICAFNKEDIDLYEEIKDDELKL